MGEHESPCTEFLVFQKEIQKTLEKYDMIMSDLRHDKDTLYKKLDIVFTKLEDLTNLLSDKFSTLYKAAFIILLSSFVLPIIVGIVIYLINH